MEFIKLLESKHNRWKTIVWETNTESHTSKAEKKYLETSKGLKKKAVDMGPAEEHRIAVVYY